MARSDWTKDGKNWKRPDGCTVRPWLFSDDCIAGFEPPGEGKPAVFESDDGSVWKFRRIEEATDYADKHYPMEPKP